MHALAVQIVEEGGGQLEEIARTFGVNWPHLVAQTISFGIVCAALYGIEIERRDVMTKAGAAGKQLIEEARAASARVRAEETRKAMAGAEQILIAARAAAERERSRTLAELRHEVGRL